MFTRDDHGVFRHIIVADTLKQINNDTFTYKHRAAYHNFHKRWHEIHAVKNQVKKHERAAALTLLGYLYATAASAQKMKLADATSNQKLVHLLLPKLLAVPACMLRYFAQELLDDEQLRKTFVHAFGDLTASIGRINQQAQDIVHDVLIDPYCVAKLMNFCYMQGEHEAKLQHYLLLRALVHAGLSEKRYIAG